MLGLVAVLALALGAARSSEARTPEERIDAVAKTLKCPVCPGESLYESRNNVSLNLKAEIAPPGAGRPDRRRDPSRHRRPATATASSWCPGPQGVDAVVWVLPVAVLVASVAALVVVFRRWRREGATGAPTDEDRALVADALAGRVAVKGST